MRLKIKKIEEDAILPKYAHYGDAGFDIFSYEDYTLPPNERYCFKTEISLEIPKGYVVLIWDKSGLAVKQGLKTMAGVIDSTYRGELKVVIFNTSNQPYEVKKGDKIAQGLLQKVESAEIIETEEISDTKRGDGGFGSTGKR